MGGRRSGRTRPRAGRSRPPTAGGPTRRASPCSTVRMREAARYPAGESVMVVWVPVGNGGQSLDEGLSGEGRDQLGHLQAAEQVAQRLGVGAKCRAAVAGKSDRG